MAVTIDHLESHYRYRVIRGFIDTHGVQVPFESMGVIRKIELSPAFTEIWIDWEREGPGGTKTIERLTFLMSSKDGPRNNHMKDYFEKEELVLPPCEPKPAKPAPTLDPESAGPPAASVARFAGKQPQEDVLLGDLTVACDCGAIFHRAIYPDANLKVHACLRCGAVSVTRQIGDEGRYTGNAWTAYWAVPMQQSVVDWLGRFPRVLVDYAGAPRRWPMSAAFVRYPTLFYPADIRVRDQKDLLELESALVGSQASYSRARCIGSACGDIPPTPEDLPHDFAPFASLRRALDLRTTSDSEALLAHAQLGAPGCELAADLLLRREDAYDVMIDCLLSQDEAIYGAGIAMLRTSRPLFSGPDDPRLAPSLLNLLNQFPLDRLADTPSRVESCLKIEALLVAIADLGVNTPEMLSGLATFMKKIARKDAYTADAIRITLKELERCNTSTSWFA